MEKPLVSVIITTKNEERNIKNCLESIKKQTYKKYEVIVVDNNSTDNTKKIAAQYTKNVFDKGPERSAQRNFGAMKAKGEYVLFLDADMILTSQVLEKCVEKILSNKNLQALVIPEKSFGEGFWAQCKAIERSFYVGVDWIEAARFYSRNAFNDVRGYSEDMISGEDWDLSQRVKEKYKIGRISKFILHNEGKLSLQNLLYKKYYYARKIRTYINKNSEKVQRSKQISPFARYSLLFANKRKLFKNKFLGFGVIFMKTSEYVAGGLGYLLK